VPGSKLRLRNIDTQQALTSRTTPGELQVFLPCAGTIQPVRGSSRFETFVREGLDLRGDETLTIDITLTIRGTAEQVTVTARRRTSSALEGRDIKESAARDVGEALTSVEGLSKVRKGGIANDVVLRGSSRATLTSWWTGRESSARAQSHGSPAFHVDFAEVQEVVITKGAFDVKNEGSLGAWSKSPAKKRPGFHVLPSLSTGSFGFINPAVTASVSNGKIDALLGYSFRAPALHRR